MKKYKYLNRKQIIGIAYICMALASAVYAANVSDKQEKACTEASITNPVVFNNGDGTKTTTTNQDDCCTTACMLANPGSEEAAGDCASHCGDYGNS
jgi:hypothetical protein